MRRRYGCLRSTSTRPPRPTTSRQSTMHPQTKEKACQLANAFFPPPLPVQTTDITDTTYPPLVPSNPIITINQIQKAINKISHKKAPGPDKIANIMLKKTFGITYQYLHSLIQASINTTHFPAPFETTTTVILANQSNWITPKSMPTAPSY